MGGLSVVILRGQRTKGREFLKFESKVRRERDRWIPLFALSSHFALEFNLSLPPLCTPAMQARARCA